MDRGVAAGVAAGLAAGVAAGVATAVADGVGVPTGSGDVADGDGLHEEREATVAAKASTMKDALFISRKAFLRMGGKSTPVEISIFRFTASDSGVIVIVQSAHVAEPADACASGAHGVTLGGSNPLVSTAPDSQSSTSNITFTDRHRNDTSTAES